MRFFDPIARSALIDGSALRLFPRLFPAAAAAAAAA